MTTNEINAEYQDISEKPMLEILEELERRSYEILKSSHISASELERIEAAHQRRIIAHRELARRFEADRELSTGEREVANAED